MVTKRASSQGADKKPKKARAETPVESDENDDNQQENEVKSEQEEGDGDDDKSSSTLKVNEEGDRYVELTKNKRATVRTFKNAVLVDVREYYKDKASGTDKPGKKGMSFTVEAWDALCENIDAINAEVKRLSK